VAQYQKIRESEFLRSREQLHQRSLNPERIRTVHMEGHVAAIDVIGKSDRKCPLEFGSSGFRGFR
jgi:hypothetical protein